MKSLAYICGKMQHLCGGASWQSSSSTPRRSVVSSCFLVLGGCYRHLLLWLNPFSTYIIYFVSLSLAGFGILGSLKPRTEFRPGNLDLLFTSVSAATVSSMSTVEMETFSNAQLIVMTILMFVGSEVFTSMLGLHFRRSKIIIRTNRKSELARRVESLDTDLSNPPPPPNFDDREMMNFVATVSELGGPRRYESHADIFSRTTTTFSPFIKYDSIKFLGFLVLVYLLAIPFLGIASVLLYLSLVPSARHMLENKGIRTPTFAVFTVVSTFASCGFVPTNENMMVFRKNSGLLLILIPQILLGNTLFPPGLRLLIWVVGKRFKREESKYLLENTKEVGYLHLLPGRHSVFLAGTVLGFALIGSALFCVTEWNSALAGGLNGYQKVIGIVFQNVSARHTGETVVDLSAVAPVILVFFVAMMYLPPYTSFLPVKGGGDDKNMEPEKKRKRRKSNLLKENVVFSQLTYLVIFIMIICITEGKAMKDDPLNFTLLNIVVEVVSAYGNVGFSTGYSCDRRLRRDADCANKWYGFSGKWSDEGKIVLILVMLFGRLKKFNINGGKAWKLL